MIYRGVAVSGFPFALINRVTGETVTTGVVVGYLIKDGGQQQPLINTPVYVGNGQWKVDFTENETDANLIGVVFIHADALPVHFTIITAIPGVGIGAVHWSYTLTEEGTGNPIADAKIWVSTDSGGSNIIASGTTNQNGVIWFWLDPGTVYVFRKKSGRNFVNPDKETVS